MNERLWDVVVAASAVIVWVVAALAIGRRILEDIGRQVVSEFRRQGPLCQPKDRQERGPR